MAQSNKVHLRAEAVQMHNGVRLIRGDRFTASQEEAADLIALRFASVVPEEFAIPTVADIQTKVESPVKRGPGRPKKQDGDPVGRYRRRDLRAEN